MSIRNFEIGANKTFVSKAGRNIGIAIAVSSVLLSLLAVPILIWDPVYSGFFVGLAVVLGGLSSVGRHNSVLTSGCAVLIAVTCALLLAHYSTGAGFWLPTILSVKSVALLLAGPLMVAVAFFGLGSYLRYRDRNREERNRPG